MAEAASTRLIALLSHPMVLIFLVALSAWLLDGFNIGPVDDGWTFLNGDSASGDAIGSWVTGRPFIDIPTFLGLTFVPHGFQGWQLMMLVVTVARGQLVFAIVRRLVPSQPLFSLACGLVATFHPADKSFFWAECVGPHFGLDLALAACLTSVVYLQAGPRWILWMTWVLQFLACFTYSSCLPLMMALPVGAWLLLRMQGIASGVPRLLEVTVPIVLLTGVYAFLVLSGLGRAGVVSSFSFDGIIAGYRDESALFVRHSEDLFYKFRPQYLAFAVIPALLAYYAAIRTSTDKPVRLAVKTQMLLFTGLIVLAGVSYLPFALSTIRFGSLRQLMAPGIFLYSALLLLVFVTLPGWFHGRQWRALVVLVLAGVTVVVGLENRSVFVSRYRAQERLLAAVAEILPDPPEDTVVWVHLPNFFQASRLAGLYNRTVAFSGALRFMYNDYSGADPIRISGGFTSFGQNPRFTFMPRGLRTTHLGSSTYRPYAPYSHLVLIDYDANGRAKLLDRAWLEQFAPEGADLHGYGPDTQGVRRDSTSHVCTMLEKGYRPSYCSN